MRSKASASLSSIDPVSPGIPHGGPSAFTVDVEEWFQVGAFEHTLERNDWNGLESRVEYQTHKVLELLAEHKVQGTFFCLGWVAERHPLLIKAIHDAGHEVACHGRSHRRIFTMSREEFFADVTVAKAQLEDATGHAVIGYRAPSFSLTSETWWAYDCLEDLGFHYSSSIYPLKTDHYGLPAAPRLPFWANGKGRILEIPLSVCRVLGRSLPASGGGYFRLLPYRLATWLFDNSVSQTGGPSVFYMHPWEVDPDQPYVGNAPLLSRFRHYTGQKRMAAKVAKFCDRRPWGRMRDIYAPLFSQEGKEGA